MGQCTSPSINAFNARYQRDDISAVPGLTAPILETIKNHRSTRNFLDEPLQPGTLEKLVAASSSASSSSMLQPWTIIALQNPEHKSAAATLCGDQDFIRKAPLFLLFCADLSRLTNVLRRENLSGKGLENMDMFLMAIIDASLASQNMALAAESLSLRICYVGAARNNSRELCTLLRLPSRVIPLFGMAIGKPDAHYPTAIKPRLEQNEATHREYWNGE